MLATKKIGIIAGDGQIPLMLIEKLSAIDVTPVVINLTGRNDLGNICQKTFSMGQVGHIIDFLKHENVNEIVIIGRVSRPNFLRLRADMAGIILIAKILMNKMTRGDDGLLKFIRKYLEDKGFKVTPVQDFLPQLLCGAGVMGNVLPSDNDLKSIALGFNAAKEHGALDKGQAVVMVDGVITNYEDINGTNALIKNARGNGRKILIKTSKPQQDMALDAPTIGVGTIDNLIDAGFSGLAVEAGKTLIVERDTVIKKCNDAGLFIIGV